MSPKYFFSAVMLALALNAAAGAQTQEPTLSQVYNAAQSNRMADAQAMMAQVLQAHPNSAKAHFVEAELLAKQGRYASAKSELGTAQRLEPQLGFARPEAVRELEGLITTGLGTPVTATRNAQGSAAGVPFKWVWIALFLAVVLIWLMRRAATRRALTGPMRAPGYGPMAPPMSPYGGAPMSPYGPMSGGMGSGLLGGLATGAAMGAGLVAGEELMHHLTDRGSNGIDSGLPMNDTSPPAQDDMGGQDFGIPDSSSWDDGGGSSWDDGGSMGGGDWN